MAVPAAPFEAGGSKVAFGTWDDGGTNTPAIDRAYHVGAMNGTDLGDRGVYPTSGLPGTGYKATTAGTEVAITATSTPCQGVVVKADPDNTEDIWVGKTGLTVDKSSTDGFRLSPGESVGVPCRNANTVFVRRGGSVDQGVYWLASKDE